MKWEKAAQHIVKLLQQKHMQTAWYKQYTFILLLVMYTMKGSWNN